jgi:capsular polysaccharide transport system permease protein
VVSRSARSLPQGVRYRRPVSHWRRLAALFFRDALGEDEPLLALVVLVVEPAVMIFFTIILSYLINRKPPYGTSMLLWAVTGIGPLFLFIRIVRRVTATRSTGLPFFTDTEVCLVYGAVEVVFVTVSVILLCAILYRWDTEEALPAVIPRAIEGWGTTACLGFGIGFISRQLWRMFRLWQVLYPMLSRGLLHVSGVYFVADALPPNLRDWIAYNPLVHLVILVRLGFYPTFPEYVFSLRYLLLWTVGSLIVGLVLQLWLGERMHRQ